jgi:hypothetical protein
MDLTSPLEKAVFAQVDKMIDDTTLNAAVKLTLMGDEFSPEDIEIVRAKLQRNNFVVKQFLDQDMRLTFDTAGNVCPVASRPGTEPSGAQVGN